jgi:hypothetical protein
MFPMVRNSFSFVDENHFIGIGIFIEIVAQ